MLKCAGIGIAGQIDGGNGRILESIFFPRLEWTDVFGNCEFCDEPCDQRARIRIADWKRAGHWLCEACLAREWFDEA